MTERQEVPESEAVPEVVRHALLGVAAQVLGALPPTDVPVALRQVQRFAARRRATAGAVPLWTALTGDDAFRARVATVWSQARPQLAERLAGPREEGPADVDGAVEWAVGAFLTRPGNWREHVNAVIRLAAEHDARRSALERASGRADRLDRFEQENARLVGELTAARSDLAAASGEVQSLQREVRRLTADADRARHGARRATEDAAASLRVAAEGHQHREADLDRRERELRAASADLDAARAVVQAGRELASTRVRLLLDTIVDAASALRREMALPPSSSSPADLVLPERGEASRPRGSRGRSTEDPALLDELLALPRSHLIVDGYNVTKLGYSHLTLDEQRRRLVDALASIATRTGAEVTCCFDGQQLGWLPSASSRTVRVVFSAGEIADDLIRRLVRAEPSGRPLIVVSSDREVATDVQAMGAFSVPSATLLMRLSRG